MLEAHTYLISFSVSTFNALKKHVRRVYNNLINHVERSSSKKKSVRYINYGLYFFLLHLTADLVKKRAGTSGPPIFVF
jgi:hypothetical protein